MVDPKDILTHLDNAMDLAEKHKGENAILKKVSVVEQPLDLPGRYLTYP